MTRADLIEAMAGAIGDRHAKIAGGCFCPSDINEFQADCADRGCYCAKASRRDATAALAAIEAAGLVCVPREPTREMMDAGLYQASHDADWADVHASWTDMLAASPLAQEPGR